MDGAVSRRDLIAPGRIAALSRRSDRRGSVQAGGHAGALAATGWMVWQAAGSGWLVPAMAVHGIVLVFLFAALHESIHSTAFRSRWLNTAVAWAAGFILVLPPLYFRCFHFAHHRHTQDPVRDPELSVAKPRTLGGYLLQVSGLPFWRERLTTTLRHALGGRVREPFVPDMVRRRVVVEARLLWTGYGAVALLAWSLGSTAPLVLWMVPAMLGQPFLRLFLLSEHTGCPTVGDMCINTRTTRTNGLVRRLSWNMPYHVAHHVFPGVPFHALGVLDAEIAGRVSAPASGYLRFHWNLLREMPESPSFPD